MLISIMLGDWNENVVGMFNGSVDEYVGMLKKDMDVDEFCVDVEGDGLWYVGNSNYEIGGYLIDVDVYKKKEMEEGIDWRDVVRNGWYNDDCEYGVVWNERNYKDFRIVYVGDDGIDEFIEKYSWMN